MTQITDLTALIKRNARLVALIAVIVVLVIVMLVFYSGSQSSADQQAKVKKQLASAQVNLTSAQAKYNVTTLQAEQDSLPDYRSVFPPTFPSNDLNNYISAGATNYGIAVVRQTPKGAVGTQTVGGTKYVEYDTSVQITGGYTAMASFLSYLENGPFLSLSIKDASFTASGGTFTVVILAQS
jgi:Tfp pilus assembly protein PilO